MLTKAICAFFVLALVASDASAQSHEPADAIRHMMKSTWDKPQSSVEVEPITIVADYAIAGWTQDDMGGRALLRRKGGAWVVTLCAGDQLKQVEALHMAGIDDDVARRLVAATAENEAKLAPARLAMFSRFKGLVTIDEQGSHTGHDGHKNHH